jgi:hypothetical protein
MLGGIDREEAKQLYALMGRLKETVQEWKAEPA